MVLLAVFLFLSCSLVSSEATTIQSADQINDSDFIDWFHSNGGTTNGITVGDCRDQGRGILAVTDITQDQEVMYIPPTLIFSAPNLISSGDPMNIEIVRILPNDDDAVIASLLLESWKDTESFYSPYLKVLPKYVASLIHFTGEELSELHDSDFENEILSFQNNARKSYQNMISAIEHSWPKQASQSITYEKYLWASTIINSRGLRFRGKVYLSPLADMFNYLPHTAKREAGSGEFFLQHHKLSEKINDEKYRRKLSISNGNHYYYHYYHDYRY